MNHNCTPLGMSRRHFLGHLATSSALALPASHFLSAVQQANAQSSGTSKRKPRAASSSGWAAAPATWTPGASNPRASVTAASSSPSPPPPAPVSKSPSTCPRMAKQMHHLSIIRSLNSREGNHDRGTYLMHTGYAPNPTIVHPSFGSVCSYELGDRVAIDLPHFISINTPGTGAGFLGMTHAPFWVQNPTAPIANLQPPAGIDQRRLSRRLQLLGQVEDSFGAENRGFAAADHKAVYTKTIRMMNSRYTRAFKLDDVAAPIRDRYGRNSFGQGCLMARRLVEAGVTFIEVSLGGWDNHQDIFNTLSGNLLPQLDQGMSALVEDLAASGLLDSTLVVWMGEFGRTPRVNENAGRDHWPRSWSVVLGGAGMKGGQVIGATDKDGVDVTDREVGVMDLVATMTQAMGIDLDTQFTTPRGRPYKVVDGGQPIAELF